MDTMGDTQGKRVAPRGGLASRLKYILVGKVGFLGKSDF